MLYNRGMEKKPKTPKDPNKLAKFILDAVTKDKPIKKKKS